MPIYEYHCPNCGHEMEVLQSISEAPLTHCPECDKDTLQKKISAGGFQLKGSGWYETDFKDKKPVKKDQVKPAEDKPAKVEQKKEVNKKDD